MNRVVGFYDRGVALIAGRVYAPEFPGRDEEQELLQISQSLPLHAARHQQ